MALDGEYLITLYILVVDRRFATRVVEWNVKDGMDCLMQQTDELCRLVDRSIVDWWMDVSVVNMLWVTRSCLWLSERARTSSDLDLDHGDQI